MEGGEHIHLFRFDWKSLRYFHISLSISFKIITLYVDFLRFSPITFIKYLQGIPIYFNQ